VAYRLLCIYDKILKWRNKCGRSPPWRCLRCPKLSDSPGGWPVTTTISCSKMSSKMLLICESAPNPSTARARLDRWGCRQRTVAPLWHMIPNIARKDCGNHGRLFLASETCTSNNSHIGSESVPFGWSLGSRIRFAALFITATTLQCFYW